MTVIIQLQYSLTDSSVVHDVKDITQSSLHPTQPIKNLKKLWPNPTQPMDGPNPWPTLRPVQALVLCQNVDPSDAHARAFNLLTAYFSFPQIAGPSKMRALL